MRKIAFIIPDGIYCYVFMPCGLKNALSTFVRATHKTLKDLIQEIIEVYIDDIVVKYKQCTMFV
jgi:hypothetical protein